jgi:hypothetical protein
MSKANNEHLQVEYQDISENLRHYSNMRFAQMTLFLAITAGLGSVIINDLKTPCQWLRTIVGVGGAVATVIFWVLEERAADYWHHFRQRAVQLEEILGYAQYRERPARSYVTATNAVRVFYTINFLYWVWFTVLPSITTRCGNVPDAWLVLLVGLPMLLSIGAVVLLSHRVLRFRQGRNNENG